ncbi:MAG: MBL fold metallo-hydrolase [Promethearchaeota archaeon]|jgi:glyoxylase-like metal-dependent hydrolase (beta-lactamase superfamily II)
MEITSVDVNLKYINLGNFINSWVYKSDELCFLVDPGPTVTINSLKKGLDYLDINKNDLKYIFLTHPHIDHAGGAGKLLNLFPQAKIMCHPNGIRHLINPKRLWEGSLKVLGKAAEFYGKIEPVPEDHIFFQENIENGLIKVIETLGHSPHHQSYLFKNILFVGEACGHHYPTGEIMYIRPATPPIFDYDKYVSSLQKLINLQLEGFKICFPHWGTRDNAALIIKIAYDQINTWLEVIESIYDKRKEPNFMELIFMELKKADKIFANLELLSQEVQSREPFTMRQSVAGIIDYIEKKRMLQGKVS